MAKADVTAGSVVFVDTRSGDHRIAIRTSDGTVTDLTSASEYAITPDVSADGSRIAFAAQGTCVDHSSYQGIGLKVENSDGTNEVWLTQPHCHSGGAGQLSDTYPRWSPDGTQVAYVHEDDSGFGSYSSRIYKVNADGTGVTDLTTTDSEYEPPSWSPDGTKIAFDTLNAYYNPVLYVMDASDGGNKHLVSSPNTGNESRPTWAPSGNRIYFVTSGGFGYYDSTDGFASAESLSAQTLTGGSASGGEYDLSADGSTLAYRAPDGSTGCGELWTLDVSSDTATEVTHDTCSSGGDPWYNTPRCVKASWPNGSTKTLVALGDSVAAGEGINYGFTWNGSGWDHNGPNSPSWMDTTPALGDNYQQCHQSGKGYPNLIALNGGNYRVYNMACTGATALENNTSGEPENGGVLDAEQFDTNGLAYPETGYITFGGDTKDSTKTVPKQLDTTSGSPFDSHNPDVVLITLGANDILFGAWLHTCYTDTADCSSSDHTALLNSQLSIAKSDLTSTLGQLNTWASGKSKTLKVYVTNYYDPFSTSNTSCIDVNNGGHFPGISVSGTGNALDWLKSGLSSLNSNISADVTSAQTSDTSLQVHLVDISGVMSGHEFCTSDPWVYGPSLDYPDWENWLGRQNPAPFHPTPDGQRAIEGVVSTALSS